MIIEINWLQVVAIILGSGVISALLSGLWLNNRTEKIKTDFQRNLYEFQTRFSIYHQKKAIVIENLFELLAKLQNDLQLLIWWDEIDISVFMKKQSVSKEQLKEKIILNNELLTELFDEKRIFFDENIKNHIFKIKANLSYIINAQILAEELSRREGENSAKVQRMQGSVKDTISEISPLMAELEKQFRKLLSTENPNEQIEKK